MQKCDAINQTSSPFPYNFLQQPAQIATYNFSVRSINTTLNKRSALWSATCCAGHCANWTLNERFDSSCRLTTIRWSCCALELHLISLYLTATRYDQLEIEREYNGRRLWATKLIGNAWESHWSFNLLMTFSRFFENSKEFIEWSFNDRRIIKLQSSYNLVVNPIHQSIPNREFFLSLTLESHLINSAKGNRRITAGKMFSPFHSHSEFSSSLLLLLCVERTSHWTELFIMEGLQEKVHFDLKARVNKSQRDLWTDAVFSLFRVAKMQKGLNEEWPISWLVVSRRKTARRKTLFSPGIISLIRLPAYPCYLDSLWQCR